MTGLLDQLHAALKTAIPSGAALIISVDNGAGGFKFDLVDTGASFKGPDQLVAATPAGTRKILVFDDAGGFAIMTAADYVAWAVLNDGSIDPFAQGVATAVESGMTIPTYRADGSVIRLPVGLLSNASGGVATAFSLSTNVSTVTVGNPVNLLVMPTGAAWPSGVTVTPSSSVAGAFSPASATPSGSSTVTFVFTPSATGTATLNASTTSPVMTSGGGVPVTVSASGGGGTSFDKTNGNFQLYYDMRTVTSGAIPNLANPGTGDLTLGGGVSHNAPVSDFAGLVGSGGAGMACSRNAGQIGWDGNNPKAWVMELYSYDNQSVEGLFTVAGLTGSAGDFGYVQGGNMDPTIYNNNILDTGGYYQGIGFSAGLGGYADSILRMVWVQEDTTNWKAFVAARRAGQAWSAATIRGTQTGTLSRPFAIAASAPIKFFNTSSQYGVLGMVGMISGAITDAQATALMNNPYQPIGG